MGGVFNNSWFSCSWPPRNTLPHINARELWAVVAAVFTWGHTLKNKQIIIYTDNLAIVHVWKSGSCQDKSLMHLVRSLFLYSARNNINILMEHMPGHHNYLADCLSRLQVEKFHQLCPGADCSSTQIPAEIWTML